jgi:hypothetical protein
MTEMQDSNRKVTVFVKSVKKVITEKVGYDTVKVERRSAGPGWGDAPTTIFPIHKEKTVTKDEFVLPEDQQDTVKLIQETALSYGFKVEVVDVTKENFLRRQAQEHTKHITTFPTVVTDDGRRIEGAATKQQVEALLTNEHKHL